MVQRGQIYFVSFEPTFGHEMGGFKMRPAVVVSIPKLHNSVGMIVVVPGTSIDDKNPKLKDFPNQATVQKSASNGLDKTTVFQGHQLRAISDGRIVSRPIGSLSESDLNRVLGAVRYTLGIELF